MFSQILIFGFWYTPVPVPHLHFLHSPCGGRHSGSTLTALLHKATSVQTPGKHPQMAACSVLLPVLFSVFTYALIHTPLQVPPL